MPSKDNGSDDTNAGTIIEERAERASIQSLLDEERNVKKPITKNRVRKIKSLKYLRISIFLSVWIIFTVIMLMTEDNNVDWSSTSVPANEEGKYFKLKTPPEGTGYTLILVGPFKYKLTDTVGREISPIADRNDLNKFLNVVLVQKQENQNGNIEYVEVSKPWKLQLATSSNFEQSHLLVRKESLKLTSNSIEGEYFYHFTLQNVNEPLPILLQSYPGNVPTTTSIVVSILVVISFYLLLFWDLTSRTIIALMFCTLALSIMGIYYIRPPLKDIPQFVDIDYVLLLMGLTMIVGVFAETGGDRYLAVQVFRLSGGHIWPLLTILCVATAFGAAFLDQLTIMVLITLFVIRYCEIQNLNAGNVLTCLMLFSNIGYMLTPNVTIQNGILDNPEVLKYINTLDKYWIFVLHMAIPVGLSAAATYIFLRFYFRSTKSMQIIEAPIALRLRHAIRFWNRTAKTVGDYSEMEKAVNQTLKIKVDMLRGHLRRLSLMSVSTEDFKTTLTRLQEKHKLKNKPQIIMCAVILALIIIMQILFAIGLHHLTIGWTCLLFALILLALVHWHDFESLMSKMDWSTILLIACIMIITKAVAPLGLVDIMSDIVVHGIRTIDKKIRLYCSVIILICVSAIGSAFFDTTYVCDSISAKVIDLVKASDVTLPLEPLILSIALGAGFGCNVTLLSSFSNIVCSGLTEKHDFKIYFWDFFKVGAFVMLFSILLSIAYVLLYVVIFF